MKASALFDRAELKALTQASDLRAAASIATDWGVVALAMATVAAWTHPVSIGVALWVIGGRQLGLAVLTHECSHRSLFRTRWLNDVAGVWLCAAPVWADVGRYRVHHMKHHTRTGTPRDPDRGLVAPFPTSRASLVRKLGRDLVGWTAVRRVLGLAAMDLGLIPYTASTDAERLDVPRVPELLWNGVTRLGPVVITNAALLAVLTALGHPALYLLWVGAWCTTYSVVLRVRSIAEHACTDQTDDPLRNTRTTHANPLARLVVAPHHVNYHLEHHLLMTVPHWRLPDVHLRLRERGLLDQHNTAPGYLGVLRLATSSSAG